MAASRARDSMYKNGKLFRRMLDERKAGSVLSGGFLDGDTESLGCGVTLWMREIATQMMKYQSQAKRQQGKSHQ